jgi:hypothetical protein
LPYNVPKRQLKQTCNLPCLGCFASADQRFGKKAQEPSGGAGFGRFMTDNAFIHDFC